MSGENPLVSSMLRSLGRDLGPYCGIHGDLVRRSDRRCPSCELDRLTPPVISDHADQATNPRSNPNG
jgi:hypothetical protein